MENEIVRNCGTCRFYDACSCSHELNLIDKPNPSTKKPNPSLIKFKYCGTRKKVTFSDYCQLWMFKPTEK